MTFSQFLSILRARWKAAFAVFALTLAATVTISLLLPPTYTGTASVVIDPRPDPVSSLALPSMIQPAVMATQVDIISSERVARKVVQSLKLLENPAIRQQFQQDTGGVGNIETWMVELLTKRLEVKPSRESNVIMVSYKAPDPRFAAGIANAFVQAYLDTSLELRVNPAKQYSAFFDQRAKDARDALEKAQAKVSEFQRSRGIIVTDERLDVENARLNELSTQLVMIQAQSADSQSRQAQASGAGSDRIQEVLNNGLLSSIKADLTRSEARLQELNARYGENHPLVIEAKANINELRSRLNAETRKVAGGVNVTNTINRQREAQARTELEAQRSKVLKLKAVRDEGMVLLREVDNAQRTYDAVLARLNQTSMESQTTQSNVNILTPAVPPNDPSFPRLSLNVALATVAGLLLAVALAMALEFLDRRIRSADDVRVLLELPVLGTLPSSKTNRRAGEKQQLLAQQRVVGQLSAPRGGA